MRPPRTSAARKIPHFTESHFNNTRDRRLFELTTAQPKETESRPSAPVASILRRRTRFPSGACFGRALFGGRHTVNGTPRISSIQPHPSSDPKNRPKIEEPPEQYGGRRKVPGQERKSSASPYSCPVFGAVGRIFQRRSHAGGDGNLGSVTRFPSRPPSATG